MTEATKTLKLLKTHFGYDQFRPLQAAIIDHALSGGDALVLMPTGGGKSLCYQLPALALPGVTLVVSPLIALMKDQVDALRANGITAEFINSSLTAKQISLLQGRVEQGDVKLLYVAPERLAAAGFRSFLARLSLSLIAIDEAHCISEWGHDFRPDYRNLARLRIDFADVPIIALTATATPRVREDIASQLGLQGSPLFQSSFDRPNLTYIVQPKQQSFARLQEMLNQRRDQSAIIYCFSRRDTEKLALALSASGFPASAYHAGLTPELRAKTQDRFIRDETSIIVATIAFGMGIDKPDIRLVVHYDLPKTIEGYYQEIGRAGRDGLPSDCVLFYSHGDTMKHTFFVNQLASEEERQNGRVKLSQVVDYCETTSCRRQFLLSYFGETGDRVACQHCDVCLSPRQTFDATEITQKILSAVIKTGQRFGAAYISDVLRGSSTVKIKQNIHHELSVFGIAREYSAESLKQLMRLLVVRGLLRQNGSEYPTLEVSPEGRLFLAKRDSIELPQVSKTTLLKAKAPLATDLDYNQELFELLRAERRRLAGEQGVPPFVVCGDRTLMELAYYLPILCPD